nr:hypothetical protein [Tanacetum cinerariifolium]GFA30938.1 hypothetical protein [Tanacetum cinerariifolium]
MPKLRDLGADAPTRVPCTKEEILIEEIKGKQQGHTAEGRRKADAGKTRVFGSYTQPKIDHMLPERPSACWFLEQDGLGQRDWGGSGEGGSGSGKGGSDIGDNEEGQ